MLLAGSAITSDPHYSSVVSLLHFDGADASTTFTDEKGVTWSANANAQIDTAQSKFGGASGLFDGTGDFLNTADSAIWTMSGDYTLECFIRMNGTLTNKVIASKRENVVNNNEWIFAVNSSGLLQFVYWDNATIRINVIGTTTVTGNAWHHVAFTKKGTTGRLFLGGLLEDTDTFGGAVSDKTYAVRIGRDPVNTANDWNGWIDEFRATQGVCRYVENFAPPSQAFFNS
jgi:hypothetical protein